MSVPTFYEVLVPDNIDTEYEIKRNLGFFLLENNDD
jgi:hypothetical protein